MQATESREAVVFRQVAFPVSAFDYLKDWQRAHLAVTGVQVTNNQALARILSEHRERCGVPTNAAHEGCGHARNQARP
jgi:hypothetical protein